MIIKCLKAPQEWINDREADTSLPVSPILTF